MTKIFFFAISAGLIGLGTWMMGSQAQDQDQKLEKDTSRFMQQKLNASREIVEGLATEDYDEMSKAAQQLTLISHEADWNVVTTRPYLRLSSNFRDATSRLRDAANEKNLDGATLAYIEVTLNCVRCHQYLRDESAELPSEKPGKEDK